MSEITIEDLPEEIMAIIFNYVFNSRPFYRPRLKTLVAVNQRWKDIVEKNFKYSCTHLFIGDRSSDDYEIMINSKKKFKEIWIKVRDQSQQLLYSALRRFFNSHHVLKVRIEFDCVDSYSSDIEPSDSFYSYIQLLTDVEELTICFGEFINYQLILSDHQQNNSPIMFKHLRKLQYTGSWKNFLDSFQCPNLESLEVLSEANLFCLDETENLDFWISVINLASKCKKLIFLQIYEIFVGRILLWKQEKLKMIEVPPDIEHLVMSFIEDRMMNLFKLLLICQKKEYNLLPSFLAKKSIKLKEMLTDHYFIASLDKSSLQMPTVEKSIVMSESNPRRDVLNRIFPNLKELTWISDMDLVPVLFVGDPDF